MTIHKMVKLSVNYIKKKKVVSQSLGVELKFFLLANEFSKENIF